jgi:predicted membrane channel-forming protein YqfA (hemolysin III family)
VPRVGDDDDRGAEPGESPKERHDRELIELLNELRVALPGVQVLFAFLLAVPFAQGWKEVTAFQRDVFFIAFLATTLSSALMIAPTSYHRLRWRDEDKGRIVQIGNRLTIAGLLALLVAIAAVVLLVTDYIFEKTTAVATTVAVVAIFVALWYGLPLYSRLRRGS